MGDWARKLLRKKAKKRQKRKTKGKLGKIIASESSFVSGTWSIPDLVDPPPPVSFLAKSDTVRRENDHSKLLSPRNLEQAMPKAGPRYHETEPVPVTGPAFFVG